VLQTGVNIGVLGACLTVNLMAAQNPRWVFLVGVLPALLVFWIRRNVPEPEEWHDARARAGTRQPSPRELFRGEVLPITVRTIIVCACALSAWWAFMFWHAQHLRNLPELRGWPVPQREKLVANAFFLVILVSVIGNFAAGAIAKWFGYRRSITIMCVGFFAAMYLSFSQPRGHQELFWFWFPAVGFFSGVFGLFTMFLPPLFPTLLRTTGAGFCYNIGRIAAAFGTVFFGLFAKVGDFRAALTFASFLFLPAALFAWWLPEPRDEESIGGGSAVVNAPGTTVLACPDE
jgi:MFS family permease